MMNFIVRALTAVALAITLAISPTASGAQTTMSLSEARDIFAAGNAFYRAQQYEEAAVAYRELAEAGYETASVLYNLGTTDARLGSSTLAMANLQRAKKLAPRNPDIRANLAYVKRGEAVPGSRTEADAATAESLWSKVYGWLTAEEWLLVVWCALFVCCAGMAMIFVLRSERWKSAGRALMVICGTVFVITAIPTAAQIYATKVIQKAIAIDSAEILSGPASRFTRVAELEEGQSVRMLGHESGGYERVETADGLVGYVHRSALVKI